MGDIIKGILAVIIIVFVFGFVFNILFKIGVILLIGLGILYLIRKVFID